MHTTRPRPSPASELVLREPRPGEGRQVSRYADQATHGLKDPSWIRDLAGWVDDGHILKPQVFEYTARMTGYQGSVSTSPYLRVADIGEPVPVGMIYSIQPIQWILEESEVRSDAVDKVVARLVEVNLLAVHKNQRGNGYASALLADTEAHYRDAGFTVSTVVVDHEVDPTLRPWYERRGYVFHESDERAILQFSTGNDSRAPYTNVNPGQLAGFKALAPFVSIGRGPCRILTPVYKMPVTRDFLIVRGVID